MIQIISILAPLFAIVCAGFVLVKLVGFVIDIQKDIHRTPDNN